MANSAEQGTRPSNGPQAHFQKAVEAQTVHDS